MMFQMVERLRERLSTDPRGYCSREVLNRETSMWTCVGLGTVTKYRLRGKLSSLCYGQQGKNQNWRRLTSHEM